MRLIEELWAEDPPDSARAQIQNPVSGLRKALGPAGALLRTQPPGYLLAVPENGLDESAFRTDLSDGRALWEAGDEAGAQSSSRRAVDRCRGPAYDGVDVPSVRAAAAELDELRIGALEDWAQSALAAADAADVAAELARELVTHPLRERLRALLMQAQDRIGRRDDALRVYDEGRTLIASELGVQPGLRLQNLHRELLRADRAQADRRTPAAPVMLPPELADFSGREVLVEECMKLLADCTNSGVPAAVCLYDQGGIGKTTPVSIPSGGWRQPESGRRSHTRYSVSSISPPNWPQRRCARHGCSAIRCSWQTRCRPVARSAGMRVIRRRHCRCCRKRSGRTPRPAATGGGGDPGFDRPDAETAPSISRGAGGAGGRAAGVHRARGSEHAGALGLLPSRGAGRPG